MVTCIAHAVGTARGNLYCVVGTAHGNFYSTVGTTHGNL